MADISVRAPANVKISGEHSVIYGSRSLSAAITMYATATARRSGEGRMGIVLEDLGVSATFSNETLAELFAAYGSREQSTGVGIRKYAAENAGIGKDMLPYATIAARLHSQYGVDASSMEITVHSDVPVQRGYASSAVCSAAFAMAVLRFAGKSIDDASAVDVIRVGERIVHGMETAGKMDVGTAYYGGYATFSEKEGVRKADINTQARMVTFDTGPKPPTSEMLKKVRERYDSDPSGTAAIFAEIDGCVEGCLRALGRHDLPELGRQMLRNHGLLGRLGVSSDRLDKAVSVAMDSGAYGAKLCGGGGGGAGVALVPDDSTGAEVISAMTACGFVARGVEVAQDGAKA